MYTQFPRDFIFGTATAAYQIEGGWNKDGKGLSTWDVFTHKKGKIKDNSTGDVACDTYNNFQTDVDIMSKLNMDAYRFSIAWSRVLPDGKGKPNEKGIDYYSRLIDALLEKNITPFITLFHWDMPYALYKENRGFVGRDTAEYFAEYAKLMVERFGDRVKDWITLNEPWEHAFMGHFIGEQAPGMKNPKAYFKAAHHELIGHGLGVQAMRSVQSDLNIGITLSQFPVYPYNYDAGPKDMEAVNFTDMFLNRFYLDPVFKGTYPEALMKKIKFLRPKVKDGDLTTINQPIDFLGVNYYNRVFADPKWYIPILGTWVERKSEDQRYFHPELGYHAFPDGLKELAKRYRDEYGNPAVYITENGTGGTGGNEPKGVIHDNFRVSYVKHYLKALKEAIDEGSDIRGYFYWTLIDNFEWSSGYTHPMGIIKVNHKTQERTIRDSGHWFCDMIAGQETRR